MVKLLIVCVFLVGSVSSAPLADLVVNLPGLNFPTNYSQYSGYLQATENRFLHYWLVESQNDPVNDPLILWLNGGPGCSSLLGMLTELGPFYVDQEGSGELHENPYSWNTFANIFFLESPACVGFSYDANGTCKSGDNDTATQNYLALQDFFTNKFPEYASKEFYITGESYAGIYIPTLAVTIIDGLDTFPINFQGFAIGNGYFDIIVNENSLIFFTYYHGVIGDILWENLTRECCQNGVANRDSCSFSILEGISAECLTYVDEVTLRVDANGLNPYNLYSRCGETIVNLPANSRLRTELRTIFPRLKTVGHRPQPYDTLDSNFDPACSDNTPEINYLNTDETKTALHISPLAPSWQPCSIIVDIRFNRQYRYTVDLINYAANKTRALIYNGDVDMVCNVMGNMWDIEDLGLPVLEKNRKWMNNGQVAGFVKRFQNIDFLTVKGSGHMVPGYEPAASLHMIKSFIQQTDY